jgi:hypothetical protein
LQATFSGVPRENMPLPVLPDPDPNVVRDLRHEEGGAEERRFSYELRALRPGDLATATDELLRALSAHAALAGAVFEARVVRLAETLVPGALLVGELARDLSSSGIRVSFGPSSVPAPYGAAICVGVSGRERQVKRFLREHPAWQPIQPL